MRKIYPFLGLLCLWSCLGYHELPVEYDYSYRGSFTKYRTFDIMIWSGPETPTRTDTLIGKYVVSRMKFLGYKQTAVKPHLLISYKMFPDSLTFRGYAQPEIENWVYTQNEALEYDPKKLEMKTGTLLIQFYDKRQQCTIWQGYTTATYSNLNFSDQRNIRNAIISVLDKYRFMAEGFVEDATGKRVSVNN